MIFREANRQDIPAIMALYRRQIGSPGCTWDEEYPNIEILSEDIRLHAVFVLENEKAIVSVVSGGFIPELNDVGIHWKALRNPCELARICSAEHRKGLALMLLRKVMSEMQSRGYDGFHLLVSPGNPAAMGLYQKLGFASCDEIDLYGQHWLCYQY